MPRGVLLNARVFSTETAKQVSPASDLQTQAEQIQKSLDDSVAAIRHKTKEGMAISRSISQHVEEDKFPKMQRYNIFISKMEQLAAMEEQYTQLEAETIEKMQSAFVLSPKPLKDILYHYNKLSRKGFEPGLIDQTLQMLTKTLNAKGQKGRAYEDYTVQDLDNSWRMQLLREHLMEGLKPDFHFNSHHLGKVSRSLGQLGYKDAELIQAQFDKLSEIMHEKSDLMTKQLGFDEAVYGSYLNFGSKHRIFEGFATDKEFQGHLKTLMAWQTDKTAQSDVAEDVQLASLENSMQQLVSAAQNVRDSQVDLQASMDALRQQYFAMRAATDKHAWLNDNKFIRLELLELQEKLIKAGYLEPSEVEASDLTFNDRMERASKIFYEYVQNYVPNIMSQQYEDFAKAASETQTGQESQESYLSDEAEKLSLSSLSNSLIGLHDQVMSYRIEAQRKDYLNEFYEEYARQAPIEKYDSFGDNELQEMEVRHEGTSVKMEREYLKAYQIFERQVPQFVDKLSQMVKENPEDTEGQLRALLALSQCKYEATEIREIIFKNLKDLSSASQQALMDGLMGIALQSEVTDSTKQVGQAILQELAKHDAMSLTLGQKIDILWACCSLDLVQDPLFEQLDDGIRNLPFDRLHNELSFEQSQKLRDVLLFTNKQTDGTLSHLLSNWDTHMQKYDETKAAFDPYRKSLLTALSKGLAGAGYGLEQEFIEDVKGHYNPDLVFGFGGERVMLQLVRAGQTMRDIGRADGSLRIKQAIMEREQGGKSFALPITSVVDYDIENYKVQQKPDYKLFQELKKQIQTATVVDFGPFTRFGAEFVQNSTVELAKASAGDRKRLGKIISHIQSIVEAKDIFERQYDKGLRYQGANSLKSQLMKMSFEYQALPKQQRAYIDKFVPGSGFKSMISSLMNQLKDVQGQQSAQDGNMDKTWVGVRQGLELPISESFALPKNMAPEIIDQRIMWLDDYFHYADWKEKQQSVFDNFNLLIVPKSEHNLCFDRGQKQRVVPKGIVPDPNNKRKIQKNHTNQQVLSSDPDLAKLQELIQNEGERSATLNSLDAQVSYMTNLQNLKQGLKSDYNDEDILNLLFDNTTFTDKLIESHLSAQKSDGNAEFLNRDATAFRQFMKVKNMSKPLDPYADFFVREAAKQQAPHNEYEKVKELDHTIATSTDLGIVEEAKRLKEELMEKIDEKLLQNRYENEDETSLTHQFDSEVQIDVDVKALLQNTEMKQLEPEVEDLEMSDDLFLNQYRKRAEMQFIKTKIIYKLSQDQKLTTNEKKYLKKWLDQLKLNSTNLQNMRDVMMPKNVTKLKVSDLTAEEIFAFNQVPYVELKREKHGKFALSDLVVEASHFLDEDLVNRMQIQLISPKLRKEWHLPDDYEIVETKNKEISLVQKEIQEISWRQSGKFTQADIDTFKSMFATGRNQDTFDKAYFDQDMRSLEEFIHEINPYDDRVQLLQEWMIRKEQEIKARVNLPPKEWSKPDSQLHAQIDKSRKKKREEMVAQMIQKDVYGNQNPKDTLTYKNLTTQDLHRISETLSLRLNGFDGEYPEFITESIKAVMEHPNLANADRSLLNTYCQLFEVDWRGDRGALNKAEWLSTNPVYLHEKDRRNMKDQGEVGTFEMVAMMRAACVPFTQKLAKKMVEAAGK